MPCSDGGPTYDQEIFTVQEKLDKVTDLLCKLCKRIDKYYDGDENKRLLSGGIKAWWTEHQMRDKLRKIEQLNKKK